MLITNMLLGALALGLEGVYALPEAKRMAINPRQSGSCNSAANRQCWSDGFDIKTDSETNWPGKGGSPPGQKEFFLEISPGVLSPFGHQKNMLLINGTYPGPTLVADWGDQITVHVLNNYADNGTSIHWHGVVQQGTNTEDGVNGITECPIPFGSTRTYQFIATQHGTTWYHSHTSLQYADGVLGTLQINGPAIIDYEEDLGTFPITDYYDVSAYTAAMESQQGPAGPPNPQGALVNGTSKNPDGTGSYYNVTVKANTTYRLRIINTAVLAGFAVSLDGHPFQVIESDFVPINNYTTDWIIVNIGQRYDVVFTTNQNPGNYWFRLEAICGPPTFESLAVFNYDTIPVGTPSTTRLSAPPTVCNDEKNLVPVHTKAVSPDKFVYVDDKTDQFNVNFKGAQTPHNSTTPPNNPTTPVVHWTINDQDIDILWEKPTLRYIAQGNLTEIDQVPNLNVYHLPESEKTYFWVIQNQFVVPHPIHLHGHDFYLLGQTNGSNTGTFTAADIPRLNFVNPPRRDVAMLPASAWIVIAFDTDNPGAWLMHCHIAFHVGEGLAVQFLERESEITPSSMSKVEDNCQAWDSYISGKPNKKYDSGLRL